MAEILIEPLALSANGLFNGKSTLIVSSAGTLDSRADVTGRFVLIVKDASASSSSATATISARIIKYGVSVQSAMATVSGVSAHKYKTVSVSLLSEGLLETYTYDRDIRKSMEDYLPRYYGDFEDVMRMVESEANEVTRIQAKLNELLDQFYVNTATFGLDRWEIETDIEKIPQRSVDSRRHFINAKLRGVGTVTRELLNEIVDSFYTSTVTEKPSENKVEVKLIGKRGIPKNLEDIEQSVNDVIPAHIQPDYLFTYLTWAEVNESGIVWVEADTYTHKGLEEAFLVEPAYPYQN